MLLAPTRLSDLFFRVPPKGGIYRALHWTLDPEGEESTKRGPLLGPLELEVEEVGAEAWGRGGATALGYSLPGWGGEGIAKKNTNESGREPKKS